MLGKLFSLEVSHPANISHRPSHMANQSNLFTDLTGPSAAPPLKKSSCHPTIGKDYTVSLVASYRRVSAPEDNLIKSFESGVTPVVTALFNLKSAAKPDVQLICLKALTSDAGQTNDTNSSPSASLGVEVRKSTGQSLVGLLGFVVALWQIFA